MTVTRASRDHITVVRDGAIAHVRLRKAPVNSMDLDLWQELLSTLTSLELDLTVRAAVFSSALERPIFTAGNDIRELHAPSSSSSRFTAFWQTLTTFLARLLRSRLFTIAAVHGACPAGGCALALCCDLRIATVAKETSIGLNEVRLGIPVPKYWARLLMERWGGPPSEGHMVLMTGKMLSAREAKTAGLIDAVVDDVPAMMQMVSKVAAEVLRMPDEGRVQTKQALMGELSAAWESYGEEEARGSWEMLSKPEYTANIGKVISKLTQRPSGNPKKSKL